MVRFDPVADIGALIQTGPPEAVVDAVTRLNPAGRRAVAAALPGLVRDLSAEWLYSGCSASLAVAAVGCLPTAAKAASLLARRSIAIADDAVAPVVAVARHHGVDWLADLAYRLAARSAGMTFEFIAGLVIHENVAPPRDDDFVRSWIRATVLGHSPAPLVDRLRADPLLDLMLPLAFEVDAAAADFGVGAYEYRDGGRPVRVKSPLPRALAALAAEGRLARDVLLDGCVARLLRGGRPNDLGGFVVLHDLLGPTPAEAAARTPDYLRLLAVGPNAAATTAQKHLRAGGVADLDTGMDAVLDASRVVLTRPEKPLVRKQVAWLGELARRHPDRAAEIEAITAVGEVVTPVAVVVPDALPAPSGPAAAPPPIHDVDELAEELVAFVGVVWDRDNGPAAMMLDRILDGCVRLAGDRLGTALAPVLARHRAAFGGPYDDSHVNELWGDALHAASGVPRPVDDERNARHFVRRPARDAEPAPQRVITDRLAEIAARVRPAGPAGPAMNGLLAAPTHANGSIDPAALLDRLAALGDRDPWPSDLAQALLRLPAGVDEATATRADRLGTPAGDRLAAWLRAGGLPTPETRTVRVERRPGGRFLRDHDWMPERRIVVATSPPDGHDDPTGLLTRPATDTGEYLPAWSALWPAVMPGYRALVAAWLLPSIAAGADFRQRPHATGPVLVDVVAGTGVGGTALDLALAYGLSARLDSDRVAALDALLALAGAGDLDPDALGHHLGALTAQGMLTASRIEKILRDAAAVGAPVTTWRLLAAALPPILAMAKPPPGTPDLLALAAETATTTGLALDVPGLSEVAGVRGRNRGRSGKTRLVEEAERLAAALGAIR